MVNDLALQRSKYKHLSDDEWRWFLQQVEGRERTADKLPSFASIEDWWYPVRLSCEQCSSELTARYKASLVSGEKMVDLTGGYGVDTFFLSEHFDHTDYVEQNAELCRIAEHNFKVQRDDVPSTKKPITVHNCTAEEFLAFLPLPNEAGEGFSLIFLDPARRDSHGGKVFKLADCTPNVLELLPTLIKHLTENGQIMLKLSPMLDISQAIKELYLFNIHWSVYVISVKNEVKEVLLLSTKEQDAINKGRITAIDLAEPEKAFVFTREQEQTAHVSPLVGEPEGVPFLYEPNAAILKAGAYKLPAERFGLQKLDTNTHLYVSDTLVENFPGRIWKTLPIPSLKERVLQKANVLVRNYPLTAEQLKKKWKLKDGGEDYIIGCRVAGKPTIFYAKRI